MIGLDDRGGYREEIVQTLSIHMTCICVCVLIKSVSPVMCGMCVCV